MKKSKAILMVVCAMLLVAASVMGTLAYLTSTDEVTNTFSIGKVNITLDEAKANADGSIVPNADRVDANSYKLMPGHTYNKDPQVHVKADSEPSYIRMLVTVSNIDALKAAFPVADYPEFYADEIFLLQKLVGGWNSNVWACNSVDGNVYEFRYAAGSYTVPADATGEYVDLDPLFTTITIPGTVDATALAKLDGVEIKVVAQAIQADSFGSADDAWDAFKA